VGKKKTDDGENNITYKKMDVFYIGIGGEKKKMFNTERRLLLYYSPPRWVTRRRYKQRIRFSGKGAP